MSRKKKRVILFGGAGFLGEYIVKELLKIKYFVIVFDTKKFEYKDKNLRFIKGDINNYSQVKKAVRKCIYVFNLAGISDIGEALKDPKGTVKTNILGTVNILEACKEFKIKKHVFASSIYVLSSQGGFYRTSKSACELYIQEYKKRYNLDFTIIRYGSVYGEKASIKNGISKIIFNYFKTGKLKYSGTKNAIRNFIHVKDAAKLTIKTLSKKYTNFSVLITGNQSIKIKDLMNYLKKELGTKKKLVYSNKTELGHYDKNPYSYKKIKNKVLKFKEKISFYNNMDMLINYIKNEQFK